MAENNKSLRIAIIGAPNVGKSTFFNKIIGGRRSIVENIPGVTRDRIYAEVDLSYCHSGIDHLPVTLIDTGGLFFEEDTLYQGIQAQAELALAEADCIIFIVDGRVGLTQIDRHIAKLLRNQGKPIFLLANKLDAEAMQTLASEFYNLGLGDPLPFSSLGETSGESLERLIDCIIDTGVADNVLGQKKDKPDNQVKIVLIGRPNAGKSSLLNKLVGYERSLVHDVAGTTRDALDTELIYKDREIMLIDTAGLRRKSKVYGELERYSVDRTIKGLVRADIAVLVLDATEGVTHQEQKLASLIQKRYKGCVLVLNKWDLIEKTDQSFNEYTEKVRQELGFVDYAPLVVTSAVSGQRVQDILEQCLIVHDNLHKRIKTGLLNVVLREIVSINDPAKSGAKGLRIYYGTQVEVNPPSFALFVSEPNNFHENYLRFLEKAVRKEFGFEGAPLKWIIKKSEGKTKQQY
jgi:GTPase